MPHSSTQKQIESLGNSSINSLFAIVHFLHLIEIRNNCKPFTKNAHSENFPQ